MSTFNLKKYVNYTCVHTQLLMFIDGLLWQALCGGVSHLILAKIW